MCTLLLLSPKLHAIALLSRIGFGQFNAVASGHFFMAAHLSSIQGAELSCLLGVNRCAKNKMQLQQNWELDKRECYSQSKPDSLANRHCLCGIGQLNNVLHVQFAAPCRVNVLPAGLWQEGALMSNTSWLKVTLLKPVCRASCEQHKPLNAS